MGGSGRGGLSGAALCPRAPPAPTLRRTARRVSQQRQQRIASLRGTGSAHKAESIPRTPTLCCYRSLGEGDTVRWLTAPDASLAESDALDETLRAQARRAPGLQRRSGGASASGVADARSARVTQALAAAEDVADTSPGLAPRGRAARAARLAQLLSGARAAARSAADACAQA